MGSLLCALEVLVGLALVCLVLYILWWAITTLLGVAGVAIPPQVVVILKVIAVLVLLIFVIRVVLTGEVCGFFGWSPSFRR